VAFKKIKKLETTKFTGLHFTTLREIKIMKEIGFHPNIMGIYDIFFEGGSVNIVMDYMPLNLYELLRSDINLNAADITEIMF